MAARHHAHHNHAHHGRYQQQPSDIQKDLNELQHTKTKHSSNRHPSAESPYRSSSRNTYVQPKSIAPHKTAGTDSFSFASSIKCCVGFQPKKKKSSRRVVAYHSQQQRVKEKERQVHQNGSSTTGGDNWVSLAAVKSQHSPRMFRSSPNQSTVSCPYTLSAAKASAMHKRSSGYVSEIEGSQSTLMPSGYSSYYESDSDFSDSDIARAAAGSRGKSANSVMMKLAKKFSKKNLPITRDEGDGGSIGGDSVGKGEGKMSASKRSNSVSNLDSLEG